jgi:hypothetical protein
MIARLSWETPDWGGKAGVWTGDIVSNELRVIMSE